jgi:inner membrane protein
VVDPLGLTIFLTGVGLLVIELANPGYFIGVAGTTGILVGLIQMAWPGFILGSWWSPFIVVTIAVAATWTSVEFYRRFAPAVKAPETLSSDALIGRTGLVVTPVEPHSMKGKVKVGGIVWSATSDERIPNGTDVVVRRVEGVKLVVAPTIPPHAPSSGPPSPPETETHG